MWKFLGILVVALVAVGCGPGGPRLYKTTGTVTYKTQPVDGALVTFFYENGDSASGLTDAAGKFQLDYLGRAGGTAAGKCNVSVTKSAGTAAAASTAPNVDKSKLTDEQKKKGMIMNMPGSTAPTAVAAPAALLPAKYADPKTSGLQFEILANNNNNFPIDLKD